MFTFIDDSLDIIGIAESKLDNSFPTSQFLIQGYNSPYRLDISENNGGLLVYVKRGIISKRLSIHKQPFDMQAIIIELQFHNQKCFHIQASKTESNMFSK